MYTQMCTYVSACRRVCSLSPVAVVEISSCLRWGKQKQKDHHHRGKRKRERKVFREICMRLIQRAVCLSAETKDPAAGLLLFFPSVLGETSNPTFPLLLAGILESRSESSFPKEKSANEEGKTERTDTERCASFFPSFLFLVLVASHARLDLNRRRPLSMRKQRESETRRVQRERSEVFFAFSRSSLLFFFVSPKLQEKLSKKDEYTTRFRKIYPSRSIYLSSCPPV